MNLGNVIKIIDTDLPVYEYFYHPEKKEVLTRPTRAKKSFVIFSADRITRKAPKVGHYLIYKNEEVEIYQREQSLKRVFVINEPDRKLPTSGEEGDKVQE